MTKAKIINENQKKKYYVLGIKINKNLCRD